MTLAEILQYPVRSEGSAPLITVAMPVYNAGRLLQPALMSIVKQTCTDWEFLVIDDGSTDGSLEFISHIKDARIRVIKDGLNKGLAARLNEAIDLARGRYFARMDCDDISYPERFARQVEALERDSSLDLVGARAIAISQDDQIIGLFPYALNHKDLCAKPWRGFYIAHPTWMGRIEWFRHHRYAIPAPYLCEDQELLLRSFNTSQFGVVADVTFAYRVRSKVDWPKLMRVRRSVLRMQVHHFMRTKQAGYGVLALLVYIGRITMDSFSCILQASRASTFVGYRGAVDAATANKWRDVLKTIFSVP